MSLHNKEKFEFTIVFLDYFYKSKSNNIENLDEAYDEMIELLEEFKESEFFTKNTSFLQCCEDFFKYKLK